MPLGMCKDWCQHKAIGNRQFICWKCGHVIRFFDYELDPKRGSAIFGNKKIELTPQDSGRERDG